MIDFMLIAAPRSATTWVGNLLTTSESHCIHDPLVMHHYADIDAIKSLKTLGISCTGIWMFPAFLASHPARKVILHRPIEEVNQSLAEMGLGPVDSRCDELLREIDGRHYHWESVFERDTAKEIYEYLLGLPFDVERFDELRKIRMEPEHARVPTNKETIRRLLAELTK